MPLPNDAPLDDFGPDDLPSDDLSPTKPLSQPSNSSVEVTERPDVLTLFVPPAGLIKGSKGLIVFAVIWLSFSTLMLGAILFGAVKFGKPPADNQNVLFPALFVSVFVLAGVGLLLSSIQMGKRTAEMAIAGGRLFIIQKGIFGTKQKEWDADEIARVCLGPSGMLVNDVPIMELQVHDNAGKKLGFLSGRNNDELEWLAAMISAKLQSRNSPP